MFSNTGIQNLLGPKLVALMAKKMVQFYSWKNKFFMSKIAIFLSVGIREGRLLQKKPSALTREHKAL